MLKSYHKLIVVLLIIVGIPYVVHAADIEDIRFNDADRILVLSPHPDDEVLGAGGIIQRATTLKLPVKVVFMTYGDSNPWSFMLYRKHPVVMPGGMKKMGLVRRQEAENAAQILGVDSNNLVFLGYPDFGTMKIWFSHWDKRPPLKGLLTQSNKVPYQGAYRPGAFYKGEEIVKDLRSIIREFKPTKIFVSHPADHNGDHLALYLFSRIALWDEGLENAINVYPYLIHYLGWPMPKGFHVKNVLAPPQALENSMRWSQYRLSEQEVELKKAALLAHRSQYKASPKYLLSFIKPNEIFGDFKTIHLQDNEENSVFSIEREVLRGSELPEEFNEKEKSSFIGVDWKYVKLEGKNLVISVVLSKPLANDVEASVYIFGYSATVPFAKMPKLNVKLGVFSYNVYDQNKRLDQDLVKITRTAKNITITVPIDVVGHPQRILTSARTYLGNILLDSASWVVVQLN